MYESLAPYYDQLFPASDGAVTFLEERSRTGGAVLDAACGTGSHALELARRNRRVVGIDLDEAMIDRASAKRSSGPAEFVVADMTSPDVALEKVGVAGASSFSLVYCIGNSLIHLPTRDAVAQFLRFSLGRLETDGRLVIQIINFEPIRSGRLPDLTTLSAGDSVAFERRYENASDGTLRFVTDLIVDGVNIHHDAIPLLPLFAAELTELLEKAGFEDIELFGGFDASPWSEGSFVTIASATGPADKARG